MNGETPAEISRLAGEASRDFEALTRAAIAAARRLRERTPALIRGLGRADQEGTYALLFDRAVKGARETFVATSLRYGGQDPHRRFNRYMENLEASRDGHRRAITVRNRIRLRAWNGILGAMLEHVALLQLLDDGVQERLVQAVDLANMGPVPVIGDGVRWYVWSQARVYGARSGLSARPDICVTTDARSPSPDNIVYVVECKNVADMTAQTIRSEFGKAQDLGVASYVLLSCFPVPERIEAAVRMLGLRVVDSGLHGARRDFLLRNGDRIGGSVWQRLRPAIAEHGMLKVTRSAADEIVGKLRRLESS